MMDAEQVFHIQNFLYWKIKRVLGKGLCKILCFFYAKFSRKTINSPIWNHLDIPSTK